MRFIVVGSSLALLGACRHAEVVSAGSADRELFVRCEGAGEPLVVLESGAIQGQRVWRSVQGGIAEFTRVCAYDRAGIGRSDPGPLPRSGLVDSDDLRAVIDAAKGPAIVVGHSYGGQIGLLHAARHPEQVSGVVLVDASHEDFLDVLARKGLWTMPEGADETLGGRFDFDATDAATREVKTLGSLPLAVIAADRTWPRMPKTFQGRAVQDEWIALQRSRLALSTRSTFALAEESGHMIPLDQPTLVVEVVRDLVEAAR